LDPLESGSLDFLHSSSCATLLEFRKQLDCDDYVVSIRMLDLPRRPEGITIDRPRGAEPFGPREVVVLRLLHDGSDRWSACGWPRRSICAAMDYQSGCAKRCRCCSRGGVRSKRQGNSSIKTVHDYVGMLYKHFQLSSRGELLAYFIRREPVRRRRHV